MKCEINELYTLDFVYNLKAWKRKDTLSECTDVVSLPVKGSWMGSQNFLQDTQKLSKFKS